MEEHTHFDDEAATMPLGREQAGLDPAGSHYRAPMRGGYRGGRSLPGETRPFLLTSEFGGVLMAIVAVAITAAVMPNLGARLAWILIAALVFGYTVSRGLAKAVSPSHAADPRERLLERRPSAHDDAGTTPGYGPWGVLGDYAGRMGTNRRGETRPFFETSEFAAVALAIIAVSITAAVMPNVTARLAWILIAALVSTYAVSRGLAKAGTASHSFDPRESLLGGTGDGGAAAQSTGTVRGTETRPFLLTSEFGGPLLAIIAIAISAAALASLAAPLTWILITAMTCGYVLSRGIAKIGNPSRVDDPRERLLERTVGEQREPAAR
jgi:membrane protein implicated in regulation of membrane protease activity